MIGPKENHLHRSIDDTRRAEVLYRSCIIAAGVVFVGVPVRHLMVSMGLTHWALNATVFALLLGSALRLRHGGKIRSTAVLSSFAMGLLVFGNAAAAAGLQTPIVAAAFLVPMWATFAAGRWVGYVAAVIMVAGIGACVVIQHGAFYLELPPDPLLMPRALGGTLVVILATYLAGQYEAQREVAEEKITSGEQSIARRKDEFVANVSHELRTPLTAIHGGLRLVSAGALGDLPKEAAEVVKIADRNAQRLLRLVDDLLDAQRLESGVFELTSERVELADVLRDSIGALRPYAQKFDVELRLEPPPQGTETIGDPERLAQVIDNLVSNGIKFSPKAASVLVRTSTLKEHVRVEVIDSGRGIPESFLPHVFERFTQADERSSADGNQPGSGLGLSLAKGLVESMGGEIGVHSEEGSGSTFWFTTPLAGPFRAET